MTCHVSIKQKPPHKSRQIVRQSSVATVVSGRAGDCVCAVIGVFVRVISDRDRTHDRDGVVMMGMIRVE